MITPPDRSASASASADLPLAVGPAMRASGGRELAWGIATLIAAGRLDDRLVDRALGLLRELDPKAEFAAWIDEGDAADLRFATDLKAVRWALEEIPDADVIVQAEDSR